MTRLGKTRLGAAASEPVRNRPLAEPVQEEPPEDILLRPSFVRASLPPDLESVLVPDHPRLADLRSRYQALRSPATAASMWTPGFQEAAIDLQYFRGDNAYLWQMRGAHSRELAEVKSLLTAYYVQSIDRLGLLERLEEDGLFGAYTFRFRGDKLISRDLLDSIVEIYFLEETLGISQRPDFSVLDIGAGYGRLAHRMVRALPNLAHYYCTDAIPLSTFLSEVYLAYRKVDGKAKVVPLDELETTLQERPIDLAVNIHSFSECPLTAIHWWLETLQRYGIPYLMVVPNDGVSLLSREADDTHLDYLTVIESHGYRQVALKPKYLDASLQQHGIHPGYHYLFQLDR